MSFRTILSFPKRSATTSLANLHNVSLGPLATKKQSSNESPREKAMRVALPARGVEPVRPTLRNAYQGMYRKRGGETARLTP